MPSGLNLIPSALLLSWLVLGFLAWKSAAATAQIGVTHFQLDGNRWVAGRGKLNQIAPRDVALDGRPEWIVAVPRGDGILWAVALSDGRTQSFLVDGSEIRELATSPGRLAAGMPPLLVARGDEAGFWSAESNASPFSSPVFLSPEAFGYLDTEGSLIFQRAPAQRKFPVNALPDARILADERRRLLLLTDPTTAYGHGVLGDGVEAGGIALIESEPAPRLLGKIAIAPPSVIEGIAPLWVDWNQDGAREIIVTRANASSGAQIVLFDEAGNELAAGPPVGRGFRWRHQIAVAPFGPEGELELADVLTPHIGGIVEFYRWIGKSLVVVASLPGFTSHQIGSRNLDLAVAGDFAGTGQSVLVLPNQSLNAIGAVRHGPQGAEVLWTLPLGGSLRSNLGAAALKDGRLVLGAGRSDSTLRIWQPDGPVPKQPAIEAWIDAHGLQGADRALEADPDRDGVNNLGEFAFGLNPRDSDAMTMPLESGRQGLPRIEIRGSGLETQLRIQFVRRKQSAALGIVYRVEFAGHPVNLGAPLWKARNGPEQIEEVDERWERVTVLDGVTSGQAGRRFARVVVTVSP